MNRRLPIYALMMGNFVVGTSILAPAGMLKELAGSFQISYATTGLLVTLGAIILCMGSPLMAWLTSAIERRRLLSGIIVIVTLGQAASALAPSYEILLFIRVLTLIVAAAFTPQAASTITLIVPGKERSAAIALVFLGWSLAVAFGLPLVTFLAATFGWQSAYAFLAAAGIGSILLLMTAIPKRLLGPPVSFWSWGAVFRSRLIMLVLLVTVLSAAGQFLVLTYFSPLLSRLAQFDARQIGFLFGSFGVMGVIGNLAATRLAASRGSFAATIYCLLAILSGLLLWTIGAGNTVAMVVGALVWGLGFASTNSMQQARLATIAPELASATIALNTSAIYLGQAAGAGIGGLLIDQGLLLAMGYAAAAFTVAAVLVTFVSREGHAAMSGHTSAH